jgi:catechol 2,3-dioxygenase-like lactoylglutathione lyase family enzyme
MRIDHIAFRVADRKATAEFFQKAFGYQFQTEFTIDFGDGDTADCIALEPTEKTKKDMPWTFMAAIAEPTGIEFVSAKTWQYFNYHLAPEIFISDGTPNSIVGKWVAARGGVGGVHHIAYQVKSVEAQMKEWLDKGYAEFTSEQPFKCPGLTQVFTKPSQLCGVIFEFIEREEFGFCAANVRELMVSTKNE